MATDKQPPVAVLILNWNNYPDTSKCLESLAGLTYSKAKVILVDNGSEDGSREELRKNFPDLVLLESRQNLGFAGGNNIGLRYILGKEIPYTLLLNNDTELIQPDFLETILHEIEADPEIGAVGPRVSRLDGTPDQVILPFPTLDVSVQNSLGLYRQDLDRKQAVDSLIGCCVLVRNEAIRQVGLLDENYFMYVEETEWFYRMRKEGYQILYLPVPSVLHKGGASSARIEPQKLYIERRVNVVYTLVKHGLRAQAALTAVLMGALLLGRIITGQIRALSTECEVYPFSMIRVLMQETSRKWKLAKVVEDEIPELRG